MKHRKVWRSLGYMRPLSIWAMKLAWDRHKKRKKPTDKVEACKKDRIEEVEAKVMQEAVAMWNKIFNQIPGQPDCLVSGCPVFIIPHPRIPSEGKRIAWSVLYFALVCLQIARASFAVY